MNTFWRYLINGEFVKEQEFMDKLKEELETNFVLQTGLQPDEETISIAMDTMLTYLMSGGVDVMAYDTLGATQFAMVKTISVYRRRNTPTNKLIPNMKVWELENGDYLFIQDSTESEFDFDYYLFDKNKELIDGGLWGEGYNCYLTDQAMQDFLEDFGYNPNYYRQTTLDLESDGFKGW